MDSVPEAISSFFSHLVGNGRDQFLLLSLGLCLYLIS